MASKVIMPKQGLLMTEGTITKWLKKEGESVKAGEPLFEMETDKLTITIDAQESGILLKIIRGEGETVPITETIAIIGEPGEDISMLADNAGTGRVFITPRAKTAAINKGIDYKSIRGTGPDGLIIEKDVLDYAAAVNVEATGRAVTGQAREEAGPAPAGAKPAAAASRTSIRTVKATPLAEKIAQLHDIDMSGISGSGAGGKIIKSDVEAAVAAAKRIAPAGGRGEKLVPFAGLRKIIADRMMKSVHGTAQANHRMKVDMTEIARLREKLKQDNINATYTDIFVKVVSKALMEFPEINSTLTDEGILVRNYVNMGIAVAVDNGLIVPVIKNADMMTLAEISIAASELAEKAKNGRLMPDDCSGGTFTITNLGMYDIDEFTAIINPPESAILAIGKIDRVPVVEGDEVVVRPVVTLSLTYDHRVVDGAPAARFLQRVKQLLTNPYLLI